MDNYVSTVIREGLSFGEGPRWHEGRLWFADFYRHGVYSMASDGSDERLEHTVLNQPSGLGWLPGGDLLCVSAIDQRVLRFSDDGESTFADIWWSWTPRATSSRPFPRWPFPTDR